MKLMVINGPNLNMLGVREKGVYGVQSYDTLCKYIQDQAQDRDISVTLLQSNCEGEIINFIQRAWFEQCDGIVITHGTDTMAYTASMLSFMLLNPELPIVLTGAQKPIAAADSDGPSNLAQALEAAGRLEGGVYICFGGEVIRGCRAVKTRTTSLNAFESINAPYVGTVVDGRFIDLMLVQAEEEGRHFEYYSDIEPNVALVKLIPGTTAQQLSILSSCGVKGVVVEAFGLGGVSNFRRDHAEALRGLMDLGIPVVLTSQCLYEASTPDVYEVSRPLREAGVISAGDMTTEAAVTKLMWALAQAKDMVSLRTLMRKNICGEII